MTNPALRARYVAQSIATASPGQLLVMLYDRLVVDLTQAEEALRAGDRGLGSARLMHAQDIVTELRRGLDLTVWEGAGGLSQLYGFLLTELIKANIRGDADVAASCRGLVEPLREAWRQALETTQAAGVAAATAAGAVPARVG
jgi:flagellar protein FliS